MDKPLRIAGKGERGPRRRPRRRRPKRGAFIACLEPTKRAGRFVVVAICLKHQDETYSKEALTLRQVDALERIWCINCDREHRLMRYWEALGAGVLRRRPSFLKPKLGPRPAIMPHVPLPAGLFRGGPQPPDPTEHRFPRT
jgi:hypothetical protein